MIILVSPNERDVRIELDRRGIGMEANLPFDFKLLTNRGAVTLERKKFPSDFIASIQDGRLSKECAAMRHENSQFRFVIVEGRVWDRKIYSSDGRLLQGVIPTRWTRKGIRNFIRSLRFVEGCDIEVTDSIEDTVDCMVELQEYFDNPQHISLRARPKFESDWFSPLYEERFLFWLQGCGPGISAIRAKKIAEIYHNPIEVFSASIEDFQKVKGIGKATSTSLYNFLKGIK